MDIFSSTIRGQTERTLRLNRSDLERIGDILRSPTKKVTAVILDLPEIAREQRRLFEDKLTAEMTTYGRLEGTIAGLLYLISCMLLNVFDVFPIASEGMVFYLVVFLGFFAIVYLVRHARLAIAKYRSLLIAANILKFK